MINATQPHECNPSQDTDKFCRQVLTNPDAVDYINTHFVSWGGDVSYSDAFIVRLAQPTCCTAILTLHVLLPGQIVMGR